MNEMRQQALRLAIVTAMVPLTVVFPRSSEVRYARSPCPFGVRFLIVTRRSSWVRSSARPTP
jgi:hypothetical protein